jgi:VHL beta domain
MIHSRPLWLALAITCACAAAKPALAENFVWQSSGGKQPQLVFGIPESDGALFVATCKSPKAIDVQVATDVAGLTDGEDVDVGFRGRRFNHTSTATVIGINAEVGITGAAFRISAGDSFWAGLIKQGTVKYGVAGFNPTTMKFGEDREEIQSFLDTCTGRVKVSADPPQSPPNDNCDSISQLRSRNSKQPVTITFVNRTGEFRSLMWIDFDGRPQDFGGLNPGEKKTINTFVTHPWMMTDGPGNCQEVFLPQRGETRFNITAEGGGGGD